MKTTLFAIFISILAFSGCNQPDPSAYKSDPILKDYQTQLASTTAESESLKKQLEGVEKELKESVAQAGQAAIHRKRISDMSGRISQLEQQIHFWKIRIESRAKQAQAEYLISRQKGEQWPDSKSVDSYHAQKRLRLSKLSWDNKDRIEKSKESQEKEGHEQPPH